jgi:FAD/FMN-containing dehydrogenase
MGTQMARPSPALLDALAAHLGPSGFTTDADMMAPWLTDWRGQTHGAAAALLSPSDAAQVQAIVRLAAQHGSSIAIQGGNSGMCAGATPDKSGDALLLNLRRMNRIRSVNAETRLMIADAGVILENAHRAAAEQGCRFPLTLGGKGSATLGGLVSTNAGGTQVLRHGSMRRLTAGLEVVLPDGTLLDTLTPLVKDNQGPDPKQMFIGGEGAFGIVTGVSLHLSRAVTERAVAWVAVDSPQQALALLRRLTDQLGNAVEGFEIIPDAALEHVLACEPTARRPLSGRAPWHVLIESIAEIGAPSPSEALMTALAAAAQDHVIGDAVLASSEAQADAMWHIRDSISAAERAQGPALQHDVSVPVDRMPQFIVDVDQRILTQMPGATTLSFGHLGDGNVHCHVRPPIDTDGTQWIMQNGNAASHIVYELALEFGGSISAEHGIGRTKRALFGALGDPARLAILRAFKSALDPLGTLNPGVLIP